MFKRLIASIVCLTFSLSNLQYVHAQDFSINQLPVPGTMVGVSTPFAPLALKGLIVNPQKPLEFQFIVDTGKGPQDTASVKDQANQLVKYFLAGLTIPEGDLWVNLSPYEKTRMVPEALGQTDLGRDLLAQDYILKQLTASLIYPEKDLGKEFWSRVYAKAQQQFGTTNVPVNTFNKVWILPDQAQVFENVNAAYVTKSTLKVMLDEDYLALQKHASLRGSGATEAISERTTNNTHSIASQIVREIVLPEITKEVNTGKNFAPLRQIYQALILAKWYKETIQNGLLDALYTNKNKVAGVNLNDPTVKEQIYERYINAYKKGAFNYIKEDPTPDGQVVPRKYFSGGTNFENIPEVRDYNPANVHADGDDAMISLTVGLVATGAGAGITYLWQRISQNKRINYLIKHLTRYQFLFDPFLSRHYRNYRLDVYGASLVKIGVPAISALAKASNSEYLDTRQKAPILLGKIWENTRSKAALKALVDALKYRDAEYSAAQVLYAIGDKQALPYLYAVQSQTKDYRIQNIIDVLKTRSDNAMSVPATLQQAPQDAAMSEMPHLVSMEAVQEAKEMKPDPAMLNELLVGTLTVLGGLFIWEGIVKWWFWKIENDKLKKLKERIEQNNFDSKMIKEIYSDSEQRDRLFKVLDEMHDSRAYEVLKLLRIVNDPSTNWEDLNLKDHFKYNHSIEIEYALALKGDEQAIEVLVKLIGYFYQKSFSDIGDFNKTDYSKSIKIIKENGTSEQKRKAEEILGAEKVLRGKATDLLYERVIEVAGKDEGERLLTGRDYNYAVDLLRKGRDFKVIYEPSSGSGEVLYYSSDGNVVDYTPSRLEIAPLDNAMQAPHTDKATIANGGIDLNKINVLRNGKKVNVQFDPAQLIQLEQGGFQGFTAVITRMERISSPLPLLGINMPKQEVQLAKA